MSCYQTKRRWACASVQISCERILRLALHPQLPPGTEVSFLVRTQVLLPAACFVQLLGRPTQFGRPEVFIRSSVLSHAHTSFILHLNLPDTYPETLVRNPIIEEMDLEIATRDPLRRRCPLILRARVQHSPYGICKISPEPFHWLRFVEEVDENPTLT